MDQGKRAAMLTVDRAADRLGLAPSTIRTWIARRRIEYVKVGRAVRIPESVVDDLVEHGTVPVARVA